MSSIVWAEKPNDPGALIVLCGSDGCGKTMQIERLRTRLLEHGASEVLVTKQPTDWYRSDPFVRTYLEQGGNPAQARPLALFAAADRLRHCREIVEPALRRGAVVLCDRYVFSSLVYFELRGVPQDFVATINAGIPRPDLAILLRVPTRTLFERLVLRDGSRRKHEEQSVEIVDRVQRGFERLGSDLTPVDGDRPADAVEADIWSAVLRLDLRLTRTSGAKTIEPQVFVP